MNDLSAQEREALQYVYSEGVMRLNNIQNLQNNKSSTQDLFEQVYKKIEAQYGVKKLSSKYKERLFDGLDYNLSSEIEKVQKEFEDPKEANYLIS